MTYSPILHNKHLLINNGQGLLLIDTGSPISFHKDGYINIANANHKVAFSFMSINAEYISQKVGCEISGLIGMDIIIKYTLWIDIARCGNLIGFYDLTEPVPCCYNISTFEINGIPGIIANVNNRIARLLIDTGAPISYIKDCFITKAPIIDTVHDFIPLIECDSYNVNRYSLHTRVAGFEFDIAYGTMPIELANYLDMLHIDGIIGYDLIKELRIIIDGGKFTIPPQGI